MQTPLAGKGVPIERRGGRKKSLQLASLEGQVRQSSSLFYGFACRIFVQNLEEERDKVSAARVSFFPRLIVRRNQTSELFSWLYYRRSIRGIFGSATAA